MIGENLSYEEMNQLASNVPVGSDGVSVLPFGNGAERVLNNKNIGSVFNGINFNIHGKEHLLGQRRKELFFHLNTEWISWKILELMHPLFGQEKQICS